MKMKKNHLLVPRIRESLVQGRALPYVEEILEPTIPLSNGLHSNENHTLHKHSIAHN
jgi:hypothetical protein